MDISDSELLMLCSEKNEDAETILYNRYEHLIKRLITKYRRVISYLKINKEDLFNSCKSIINTSINNYSEYNEVSFYTYCHILLERFIRKEIEKANRIKNKINVTSISFDNDINIISSNNDPLERVILKDSIDNLKYIASNKLSKNEYKIFILLLNGLSINEICQVLNKSYKQITNGIQRIRSKLKSEINTDFS